VTTEANLFGSLYKMDIIIIFAVALEYAIRMVKDDQVG
jgi:hypothetical protein